MRIKQEQNNPYVHALFDKVTLTIAFDKADRYAVMHLADKIGSLADKELDIDVKVHREKRSLEANSYLWKLCDLVADAIRSTKTEVYRQAIREVGVWHDMAVTEEDADEVRRVWESFGIGYFIDEFDSKLKGCKRLRFYHGSSLYDTKQMSRLIDYIIDEAKDLGIEVRSPDEIERMMKLWETATTSN